MLAQVHSVTWQRNRQWPVALPTPEGLPPPPPPCKPYWAGKEGEGLRGQGACLESHSERHGVVLAQGPGGRADVMASPPTPPQRCSPRAGRSDSPQISAASPRAEAAVCLVALQVAVLLPRLGLAAAFRGSAMLHKDPSCHGGDRST